MFLYGYARISTFDQALGIGRPSIYHVSKAQAPSA